MTSALQAIIFDFDGVIADSEPLHLRAFQQALADEGLELPRDEYFTRYLGYDDVGMFEALARDRGLPWDTRHVTALVARKGTRLQALLAGDDVLFPGAVAFIRAAAAEVPVAIASGALRHEIVQIVDGAGIGSLFAAIVASGDTPQSKPSPAPYLLAFDRLQQAAGRKLDPRRCVAIEDSVWGLESAYGAGLRCVGVTTSYGAAELRGAELVVAGVGALTLAALDRLCRADLQTSADGMRKDLVDALISASNAPGTALAHAALVIASIEYPRLVAEPYLTQLDAMGAAAADFIRARVDESGDGSTLSCVRALNAYLFQEQGFTGNEQYEDPRNSCLNEVLDHRTGIPITMSLVYMETARRSGLHIDGIDFPGHFLVRCPDVGKRVTSGLLIDPFHGGALLSEHDCRVLLQKHVGTEIALSKSLLAPATRKEIIVRMLLNLKRIYVHLRSFPQARVVTELLVALTPSALSELRDRGLLAYHLNDVTGALRDLQTYLKLSSMSEMDKEAREEHDQIWEHVKTLRRRVAALN